MSCLECRSTRGTCGVLLTAVHFPRRLLRLLFQLSFFNCRFSIVVCLCVVFVVMPYATDRCDWHSLRVTSSTVNVRVVPSCEFGVSGCGGLLVDLLPVLLSERVDNRGPERLKIRKYGTAPVHTHSLRQFQGKRQKTVHIPGGYDDSIGTKHCCCCC